MELESYLLASRLLDFFFKVWHQELIKLYSYYNFMITIYIYYNHQGRQYIFNGTSLKHVIPYMLKSLSFIFKLLYPQMKSSHFIYLKRSFFSAGGMGNWTYMNIRTPTVFINSRSTLSGSLISAMPYMVYSRNTSSSRIFSSIDISNLFTQNKHTS